MKRDLKIRLHVGAGPFDTKAYDAETGDEIKNLKAVSFHIEAGVPPVVTLELCPVALLVDGGAIGAKGTLNEEAARQILGSYGYDLILKTQVDAERAARA